LCDWEGATTHTRSIPSTHTPLPSKLHTHPYHPHHTHTHRLASIGRFEDSGSYVYMPYYIYVYMTYYIYVYMTYYKTMRRWRRFGILRMYDINILDRSNLLAVLNTYQFLSSLSNITDARCAVFREITALTVSVKATLVSRTSQTRAAPFSSYSNSNRFTPACGF